ncbi:MAG: hypothetical protein ACJ788_23515, partial [Ktedonobacteraceae bacterium]
MQGQKQTEASIEAREQAEHMTETQKQPNDQAENVATQEQTLDESAKIQPSGLQTSISSRRGVKEFDWLAVGIV